MIEILTKSAAVFKTMRQPDATFTVASGQWNKDVAHLLSEFSTQCSPSFKNNTGRNPNLQNRLNLKLKPRKDVILQIKQLN